MGFQTSSITPRFLVALLQEHGISSADLLAAAGLSPEQLESPELRMPWTAFCALWARAAQQVPEIGLSLVERFPEGQMHMVAHLAIRCESLAAALQSWVRFARLVSSVDALSLECPPGAPGAALVYQARSAATPNPWLVEHYFSMTCVFTARVLGRSLPIRAVQLCAPPQAPAAAYRRRFGVDPEFGATRNALLIAADCLDWPLRSADTYLRSLLERALGQLQPTAEELSWSERVRQLLARQLLRGQPLSLEQTAGELALSVHTLRRRLSDEGENFRNLADLVRRDLAREHLRRGLSSIEVCYLLGFSEPAAFQHACRRWFGVAAGRVRLESG